MSLWLIDVSMNDYGILMTLLLLALSYRIFGANEWKYVKIEETDLLFYSCRCKC